MFFFGKSAELTQYSEFVVFHCSSSISFAVLNDKPIVSLVNNSIREVMPNYFDFIINFSKTLGSKLINMDTVDIESIELPEPDKLKYSEYRYNYLTSPKSEGLISSEIFIETIMKL